MTKKTTFTSLLLLLVVTACFTTCKKENNASSSPLFCKWEVRRVNSGSFARFDSTYKAGNGNIYKFNSDSTFTQYAAGKVILTGSFHIRIDSGSTQNFEGFFRLNNDVYGNYISLYNNILIIGTTAADGNATIYNKIDR